MTQTIVRGRLRGLACGMVALLAALVLTVAVAAPAHAREYSIDSVNINATVATDGTLSVQEVREFDFSGSFHGVYWKVPKGYNSNNGLYVETRITYVGLVNPDGSITRFTESDSGGENTYQVNDYSSYDEVKLYSSHEDETARFVIAYDATNIVTRWDDCGEVYWKFVSDGWDEESQNVTCTVRLPIPSGENVVAGDNVRAWGHGPLDATVGFATDGSIVYNCPGVGGSEFAEARITFPAAWLSGCPTTSGSKLDGILAEEQREADLANQKRAAARAAIGGVGVVAALSVVAGFAVSIIEKRKYQQTHKPQFQDKYFRDVPTADHPAVLGLLAMGKTDVPTSEMGSLLTASLMRLTDMGIISLEKVTYTKKRKLFGESTEEDYRLTQVGEMAAPGADPVDFSADKADRAVLRMLFQKIAKKGSEDKKSLLFSDVERYAKNHPESYESAYNAWSGVIEGEYARRFAETKSGFGKGVGKFVLVGILEILVCFGGGTAMAVFEVNPLITVATFVLPLCALAFMIITASKLKPINKEGVEVKAQLDALKRWLTEFTRLNEAVPRDVILWNRLLVMAVALGVADKVIDQLKVVAPEVLSDPRLAPTYGWYAYGYNTSLGSPASAFGSSMKSAHSVSTAALASSSSSSGGGGGGGFSGGGGGGFGGGGGGGAF